MFEFITPVIITYNEAANIARTLNQLVWAKRILVVDSGSTDGTLEIMQSYPQIAVVHRAFDNFANQCNFAISQVDTEWVLSLDADYELSAEFRDELSRMTPASIAGYQARFVYRVHGRSLRGTLYPPRTVLYRKDKAHYENQGHGHRVVIRGQTSFLSGVIYHDDRKALARWFASQQQYARVEADHLLTTTSSKLTKADKIRRLAAPAPLLVFAYVLLVKGCLLDGWPGWFYALQRLLAETMLAIQIIDVRLQGRGLISS